MKTILITALLTFAALRIHANTPPTPEGGPVGKYQVASGTVQGLDAKDDRQATFRIDTTTGRAWTLQAVPYKVNGKFIHVSCWVELHETNGELYRAALNSMSTK